ncbi:MULTISPECIES: caspase, EACC1-associated type [unclassified Saccharothrix]|uniref:caspase, EACC1-associated type n=1 Tax=unclassified Saccharothrix TaxID=2593673 RepID=UPI00307F62B7
MRRALLIATDTYGDPTFGALRAPRRDAEELEAVLRDEAIGAFRTEVLLNPSAQLLREHVDGLFTEAGHDDVVLLYVSGHGVKDRFSGQLHFATTDTRNDRLASTAVSAQFVRERIDHSLAAQVVVWLDCCYGGAFPSGMLPRSAGTVDVVEQLEEGRGCVVMTASTHIQYAYEPDSGRVDDRAEPSVFTKAIIEGLRTGEADLDGDGEITDRDLYGYVYERVRRESPDQTPTHSGVLSGDLRIAYAGTPLPRDLPDELRRLLRSNDPALRLVGVRILGTRTEEGDPVARAALEILAAGPNHDLSTAATEALTPPPPLPAEPEPLPQPPAEPEPQPLAEPEPQPPAPAITPLRADTPQPSPAPATVADAPQPEPEPPVHADSTATLEPSRPAPTPPRPEVTTAPRPVRSEVTTVRRSSVPSQAEREPEARLPFAHAALIGRGGPHLAFEPGSARITSGNAIWNTRSWHQAMYLVRALGPAAFSPDGTLLAVTGHGELVVHELRPWPRQQAQFHLRSDDVRSVSFSHDGAILAVHRAGFVDMWQRQGDGWKRPRHPLRGRETRDFRLSAEGPFAVGASDTGVALWDTATWQQRGAADLPDVDVVAVSGDGTLVAAASPTKVVVWDTSDWSPRMSLDLDPGPLRRVSGPLAFSADLRELLYRTGEGLELWDLALGRVVQRIPTEVVSAAFSPDGRFLAGTAPGRSTSRDLWVWARDPDHLTGLRTDRRLPPPAARRIAGEARRVRARWVSGAVSLAVGTTVPATQVWSGTTVVLGVLVAGLLHVLSVLVILRAWRS